mmetsp:Transcript_48934/g.80449  ORF Transcript_48934/g.80449 Transcript_48934/m.80449 type:complete len:283 (-) Transcript_48934:678-1526(-)
MGICLHRGQHGPAGPFGAHRTQTEALILRIYNITYPCDKLYETHHPCSLRSAIFEVFSPAVHEASSWALRNVGMTRAVSDRLPTLLLSDGLGWSRPVMSTIAMTVRDHLEPVAVGHTGPWAVCATLGWVAIAAWFRLAGVAIIAWRRAALHLSRRISADNALLELRDALLRGRAAASKATADVHHLDSAIRAPVLDVVGDAGALGPHGLAVAPRHSLDPHVAHQKHLCLCHVALGGPVLLQVVLSRRPLLRATLPTAHTHVHLSNVVLVHFDQAVLRPYPTV